MVIGFSLVFPHHNNFMIKSTKVTNNKTNHTIMNYTEELALVLTAYNDADYPRVERYNRIKTIHHIAWAAGDPC